MDLNNYKKNKQSFTICITLVFTLIFGTIGCSNSSKEQTTIYSTNSDSNIINKQESNEYLKTNANTKNLGSDTTDKQDNNENLQTDTNSENLWSTSTPQQKNNENLQGSILPGNFAGKNVVLEKGSIRFFLSHDGDRMDYLTRTGLYFQSVNSSVAKRLVYDYIESPQVAGDFVYYIKDKNKLCRINTNTKKPKEEIVQQEVNLYSIYDRWVYYWNKNDTFLYRLDLSNIKSAPKKIVEFKELNSLMARGDFILVVERVIERSPQKVNTILKAWKLALDGSTKYLFLSTPHSSPDLIQPYGNYIYYEENNTIWSINSYDKNKKQIYRPENSKIISFIVFDNRIYIEEYTDIDPHMYVSVDLQGKGRQLIFTYRSPIGTKESFVNGAMDGMAIKYFNVTQNYLFLTGRSAYLGEILTTRIPIAGKAEKKKEEVFFNGAWRSYLDYVKEAEHIVKT